MTVDISESDLTYDSRLTTINSLRLHDSSCLWKFANDCLHNVIGFVQLLIGMLLRCHKSVLVAHPWVVRKLKSIVWAWYSILSRPSLELIFLLEVVVCTKWSTDILGSPSSIVTGWVAFISVVRGVWCLLRGSLILRWCLILLLLRSLVWDGIIVLLLLVLWPALLLCLVVIVRICGEWRGLNLSLGLGVGGLLIVTGEWLISHIALLLTGELWRLLILKDVVWIVLPIWFS